MFDEKFWLAVAFFGFAALLAKLVGPMLIKMIDGKSQQIADEIRVAKEMKEKAIQFLVEAEKYYHESTQYAEKLIKDAEFESKRLMDLAQQATEAEVNKKTAAVLERVKTEEATAIREVKTFIVSSALKSLNETLSSQSDMEQHQSSLLGRAVSNFEKIVH